MQIILTINNSKAQKKFSQPKKPIDISALVYSVHKEQARIKAPYTHGNVFLRFSIVYCSQRNREQAAHYLKQ